MTDDKYRVDTLSVGTVNQNLGLEDFLNGLAGEGWEVVQIVALRPDEVLILSRKVWRWWQR